ncbi:MAG TPA: hydrogenase maturation protease [Thermoanaerobaculia bacterium]
MEPDRTAVIGLGSVLMGDDAAGPHILRRLEAEYEIPPAIELLDLGTPGPELAHIVEGLDALIVADTVRMPGGLPGEIHILRRDDILRGPQPDRLSPHDPSLRGALLAADLLGRSPQEVLLVGIVPAETHLGIGLSPAVREALRAAVAVVAGELERLEYEVKKRKPPGPPEVWWERP